MGLVRRPVCDASDMHYVPRPQESHVTNVWQFCNSEMVRVCIRWTETFHSVAVLTLPLSFVYLPTRALKLTGEVCWT